MDKFAFLSFATREVIRETSAYDIHGQQMHIHTHYLSLYWTDENIQLDFLVASSSSRQP
jgi:hypothetical protein